MPLTKMLRKVSMRGKMAYVFPIHKGGSKQNLQQYRPVSLMSHIAKVFERVKKKKKIENI